MIKQAEHYLETLDRADKTIRTYRWALGYYFDVVGDDLNDDKYVEFLNKIRGLSPSTKRVMCSAVMGLYSFCDVGNPEYRKKMNGHYIKTIKINPVELDVEAIDKILAYCSTLTKNIIELRDRAFVLALADSGFRISELAGLKRSDIDWKMQRTIISGKGEKVAVIRFSDRSLNAIQDYLKARSKMDGDTGRPLGSLPVFAQHGNTKKVKAITADGMRKSIKMRIDESGVAAWVEGNGKSPIRIHDFRHYFVTRIMKTSGNLKLAQSLARHESISTTQRYAHHADGELDTEYEAIFN